jgi:hypothetical protein
MIEDTDRILHSQNTDANIVPQPQARTIGPNRRIPGIEIIKRNPRVGRNVCAGIATDY